MVVSNGASRRCSTPRRVLGYPILAAALLLVLNLGPLSCGCDLEITTGGLPDGVVNTFYVFGLDSDCGGDTWFLADGFLPPGIALQSNGDVEGLPTRAGMFTFTVGVVDFDSGDEAFKTFTLTLHPAPGVTPTIGS